MSVEVDKLLQTRGSVEKFWSFHVMHIVDEFKWTNFSVVSKSCLNNLTLETINMLLNQKH